MKPKSNKNTTQPVTQPARGSRASRVQARTSRPSSPSSPAILTLDLSQITWHNAQKQKPDDARTVLVSSDESPFPIWFAYWSGWCKDCKGLWLDNEGYELPFKVNHWADFPPFPKK